MPFLQAGMSGSDGLGAFGGAIAAVGRGVDSAQGGLAVAQGSFVGPGFGREFFEARVVALGEERGVFIDGALERARVARLGGIGEAVEQEEQSAERRDMFVKHATDDTSGENADAECGDY
jgi:hypothetical protein